MDSETIPRSLRDPSAAGEPSEKEKKERRARTPSPEPVQRAFSFPDDIADEEVFSTREIEADHTKEAEPSPDDPVRIPPLSSFSEFMRSQTSLAPVQEELSDDDDNEPAKQQPQQLPTQSTTQNKTRATPRGIRRIPETAELQRDSGFSSGSPHQSRRIQSDVHDDEMIRDSGVHLRESLEDMATPVRESRRSLSPRIPISPEERLSAQTPRNNNDAERLLRRSPLSGGPAVVGLGPETPRLHEPSPPPQTPEPEKLQVAKKRVAAPSSSTGAAPMAPAAPLAPANTGAAGAATGASAASPRSLSDSAHQVPRPADPTPRRVSSNTSVARLRTPEPVHAAVLRPDSPGSLRSPAGTPSPLQLRRMDKRASGDLRALSLSHSQRDLAAKAREHSAHEKQRPATPHSGAAIAALGGAALLTRSSPSPSPATATSAAARTSRNTTPVANEGRVRAKDMTDVYVSFSFFCF
jgi:hypothetical protein